MTSFVFCFLWSYDLSGADLVRFFTCSGCALAPQLSDEPSIHQKFLPVRLHLGIKAITVCIKNKIHAAVFMTWFFKITAFFLLFGIFCGADGHLIFFAVVRLRTTHHVGLLQAVLWLKPLRWSSIFKSSLMNPCYSVLLRYFKSRNHAKIFKQPLIYYFPNKCGGLA